MNVPRPEHPNPQFERSDWVNLNGEWTFDTELRPSYHQRAQPFLERVPSSGYAKRIAVPFPPESKRSGVNDSEFITQMWYHRVIRIPEAWSGKTILLHFGAVFFRARVYLDGEYVGQHIGGSVSFAVDITEKCHPGNTHDLVVEVTNNLWDGTQPSGKQSWKHGSHTVFYSRNTGIWQTVWMEAVHPNSLHSVHMITDIDNSLLLVTPRFRKISQGQRWAITLTRGNEVIASTSSRSADGAPICVKVADPLLWSPSSPELYDLTFEVHDRSGAILDKVRSYVGFRKVHVEDDRIFLNNEPVYLRFVLDQGYYPDGIWTAPTDDSLRRDIELSLQAGFNGARLHQKVFEPRFLYWADKLGYLLWGESASWGFDYCRDGMPHRNFLSEWREIVERDRNHPSIIGWTPLNETRYFRDPEAHERVHREAYDICKALDPSRPVNDSSGYIHHKTDLYTVHDYTQERDAFSAKLTVGQEGEVFLNYPGKDAPYQGQPYIVDEFGGITWSPRSSEREGSIPESEGLLKPHGYGIPPGTLEEFYDRLEGLVDVLFSKSHIAGWCYTQLTDVEQEQNGIYYYDRTPKFNMKRIRQIFIKRTS